MYIIYEELKIPFSNLEFGQNSCYTMVHRIACCTLFRPSHVFFLLDFKFQTDIYRKWDSGNN